MGCFWSSLYSYSQDLTKNHVRNITHHASHITHHILHRFHSEILASLNFNKNNILSPGWENNHTLKCCSGNFPTYLYLSRFLEEEKKQTKKFECMVILKSRGQCPKKIDNYGTNVSHTFNKNLDLVPWIGEYPYTPMLIWYFSNNLDIYDYVGKLPEQHFSV